MTTNELHVIFGTGPLGMATARALVAQGKRVRMVNRGGRADVAGPVEVVRGDATNLDSARAACASAAVVYQCAQPAYTDWPEQFPPIQAGVIAGAAAAGAKLVVGDNLYMYGDVPGPLTEDLPYAASGRKGRTRAQMAEAVLEAHRGGVVRAAIGRASDFYGPGVLGSIVGEQVFYPALAGKKVTAIGSLDMPHSYTYIEDFGRGLAILGEREEALGQVWHIPNAAPLTMREFLALVFEEAGHTPKIGRLPGLVVRIAGLVHPLAREGAEMLYEFEKPFLVDHGKFERAFGNIATPHREAIRRTVAWFRQHPRTGAVTAH